eukprot:424458-Pelagomonas_calceolata.AAC.1
MPGVQRLVAINTLLCPLLHAYFCSMDLVLLHTVVSLAMHAMLRAAHTSILLLAACRDMMQPLMNKHLVIETIDEAIACLSVHCMG